MSEFDEANMRIGFRRSLVTAVAALVYVFGYGIGTVSVGIATTLMLGAVGIIAVSIASSWRDESPLRWIIIIVKGMLALAGVAGVVAFLTS